MRYIFDPKTVSSTTYSLSEVLDLNIVPSADKTTAKFKTSNHDQGKMQHPNIYVGF